MRKQSADGSQYSVLNQTSSLECINVLGVRISAVNLKSSTGFFQKAIEYGSKEYVCVRDVMSFDVDAFDGPGVIAGDANKD
ncbi:hypothetical protein AB9E31_35805, partial [Rhizobium leguminosarum]